MARQARKVSESGIYHVILRGVNKQDVFLGKKDYEKMIKVLDNYSQELKIEIIVFCLMSNHIHLLVYAENDLGLFAKKVADSYVYYFNKKYERVGHLFQDRFRSEVVGTERYFLTVARYILRNPEKAGICKTEEYVWSSWRELDGAFGCSKPERLLEFFGSMKELKRFLLQDNDDVCMEATTRYRLSDSEGVQILRYISGDENVLSIAFLSNAARNDVIARARKAGLAERQIARITGIDRGVIRRALRSAGMK